MTVVVGDAAKQVGKTTKVRIERVLDDVAYASLVGGRKAPEEPITAESAAEKPTRKPPAKKQAEVEAEPVELEAEAEEPEEPEEPEVGEADGGEEPADEQPAKKKTRRGSRGGRRRKKKPAGAAAETNGETASAEAPADGNGRQDGPTIHLPDPSLGREEPEEEPAEPEPVSENGAQSEDGEQPAPKKKTRRGSRGGRNRRRRSGSTTASAESAPGE
jgi:ribonuclease E